MEEYKIDMLGFFPAGIPEKVLKMCETKDAFIVDAYPNIPLVLFKDVSQADTEKYLQWMYDIIGCELIDHCYRSVNGNTYCFVCDDEGWLKPNMPSAFVVENKEYKPILCGNLLICGQETQGDGYNSSFDWDTIEDFCEGVESFIMYPCHFQIHLDD